MRRRERICGQDIAYFPNLLTGEHQRIEHWRTAMQQGRIAAHNMAGKETPYDSVPFFWTRQFDAGLPYVAYALEWEEIIYQGDVHAGLPGFLREGKPSVGRRRDESRSGDGGRRGAHEVGLHACC